MRPLNLVQMTWIRPFSAPLQRAGSPVGRLLARANLPALALDDPAASVPYHLAYGFAGLAARREGIDDLGFRAAESVGLDRLGIAPRPDMTLREVLDDVFRSVTASSPTTRLWLEPGSGGRVRLCYRGSCRPDVPGFDVVEQFMMGLLVRVLRTGLGPDWVPREVQLRGAAPPSSGMGEPFAESRILTGRNPFAIGFPRASLGRGARPDGTARTPVDPGPGAASGVVPEPTGFADSLLTTLRAYLPDAVPDVTKAARICNCSVRTLQRRLGETGRTYSDLTDQVRRDAALRAIREPDNRLIDVAAEAGYSDAAHFTRAFRRWTGVAPSAYRRYHAREPSRVAAGS
jgi:AraC-like DNA-binding protein